MRLATGFWTSKTTWTALAGIVTALGAALTGEITWPAFAAAVFAGLQTAFIRDTIARNAEYMRDHIAEVEVYGHKSIVDQLSYEVGSLRAGLASALQTTAENADRALTLAETMVATAIEPEHDPIREAMEANRRQNPPVFPQAKGLLP